MNAADLARLQVAKRAYQAVQPSATEVQTGVRRARLALRRPKSRRSWFSKGLVFVVLAIGSLAYAKPHALGELVEKVLPHGSAGATGQKTRLAAVVIPTLDAASKGRGVHAALRAADATPANAQLAATASADATPASSVERGAATAAATPTDKTNGAAPAAPAQVAARATTSSAAPHRAAKSATDTDSTSSAAPPEDASLSSWGRVGQALARGDEARALSALSELSESDDPRTRDKADLGRAQLLISHGNRDEGCALARSLTNRRAGSHIEREAQALLEGCAR